MSFGNRSNYCSLKDAFGVKTFSVDINPIHNMEQHSISYKVEQPVLGPATCQETIPEVAEGDIVETFKDTECDMVEKHCQNCGDCAIKFKNYGPVGTSLNEILNIILICILLFIIIYKPNF